MDLENIINKSLNTAFSENEKLLEKIIENLVLVMPEDDRKYNADQWAQQEQRMVGIVKNINALSVLSTLYSLDLLRSEEHKALKNKLEKQPNNIIDLKNLHLSEQDDD